MKTITLIGFIKASALTSIGVMVWLIYMISDKEPHRFEDNGLYVLLFFVVGLLSAWLYEIADARQRIQIAMTIERFKEPK